MTEHEVTKSLFVRAGESVQVALPNGNYHLRWTSGKEWFGDKKYFGYKHVSKTVDVIAIRYDFYSYTLKADPAGSVRFTSTFTLDEER